jgi:hypothetical protein
MQKGGGCGQCFSLLKHIAEPTMPSRTKPQGTLESLAAPVMRAFVAAVPATFRRENSTRYFSGRDVLESTTLRSRDTTTSSGASTKVAIALAANSQQVVVKATAAAGGGAGVQSGTGSS